MQISLAFSSPAPNPAFPQFPFKTALNKPNGLPAKSILNSINPTTSPYQKNDKNSLIPTMPEIMAASKAQKLDLHLQKLGPFFRVSARSLETGQELGRAEGLVRVWFGGRILHLDSIRMRRETLGMQRSIFGLGLFVGAVAVRHGFDCGCRKAELLAINDTDLYHSKVVHFHTLMGCWFFILAIQQTPSSYNLCSEGGVEKGDQMQQQVVTICENVRFMFITRKGFYIADKMVKKREDSFSSFEVPSEQIYVVLQSESALLGFVLRGRIFCSIISPVFSQFHEVSFGA